MRYTTTFLKEHLFPLFKESGVILIYFFGSYFKGKIGKMSDVDLAFLWSENEKSPMLASLKLQRKVREFLKDDRIEAGPLNGQSLSFCYNVIKNGRCIFGSQEDRVRFEVKILNEYLDFKFYADEYSRIFTEHTLNK